MSIVVMGAVFVDIKGYPLSSYIPGGRNAGRVVQVHGGVSRNIVEDIANVELRPTFVSLVDNTSAGADIVKKLQSHKVDTRYIRTTPDGMGMWLAIFDNTGDVTASISKRPDLSPIADILDEQGDEIFSQADSILLEIDMEKDIVKRTFALAEKHRKPVYAVVSNMSIAVERRDFLQQTSCFVCNLQEAGILFSDDYSEKTPAEMEELLRLKVRSARIPRMIVTMGEQGAVYAEMDGESGICPEFFEKADEKESRGVISTVVGYLRAPFVGDDGGVTNVLSNDALFKIQSDVIRAVAARESAVFVGRCADYILRENPRCVNVFLTADDADRIGRIRRRQGCTAEEARAMMERVDARRASYYNYYSSRTWGEAATYHLCVSTSPLGDEGTADFILEFAARKLNMKF